MGALTDKFYQVFRDWVTDGLAASGVNKPRKADIRAIGVLIDSVVTQLAAAFAVNSAALIYAARAALFANLTPGPGVMAIVYNDGANNGIYIKAGASGAGSWNQTGLMLAGARGVDGKSFYEIALETGYVPPGTTEDAFIIAVSGQIAQQAVDRITALIQNPNVVNVGADLALGAGSKIRLTAENVGAIAACAENMTGILAAPDAATAAGLGKSGAEAALAEAKAVVGVDDTVPAGVQLRELDDGAGNPWLKMKPKSFDYLPFNQVKDDIANLKLGYGDYERLLSLAEYSHHIFYGQSLAIGNGAALIGGPALTYAKMAVAGIRAWDGGTDFAANWASLVNLAERLVSVNGETCAYGFATMLRQLILADTGVDLANLPSKLIISAPGQGATGVVGLSKTININPVVPQQVPYPRLVGDVTYAKAAVAALGRTYSVGSLMILHGEGDSQGHTGAGMFGYLWERLRVDLQSDARTIIGDPKLIVPAITSQLASFSFGGGDPEPALEQLRLAVTKPHWALAGPQYHMPHLGDNRHMTEVGYRWMGAYFAICVYEWLYKGGKPAPLVPDRFSILGNTILLHVPVATNRGLAIDTALVPAQANYGFTAVDAAGVAIAINSVRLAGLDTIAIECATPPLAGNTRLRYAYTGLPARGNIRDNTGDTLVFDPGGQNRRMDKWMPTFQLLLRSDGNTQLVI